MKPLTIISLTALVLASVWIAQSPADNPDKLPLPELSLPLPQDQEPQAAAAELTASPADGVSYENRLVTEWVQQQVCDGRTCRIIQVPRQVMRRVAVATKTAVKQVATQALCPCGCPGCDPELCMCQTLSSPAVVSSPIVTSQRVFYSTPYVTTTPYRARTPVFSRRCGPVRRLLGWCR